MTNEGFELLRQNFTLLDCGIQILDKSINIDAMGIGALFKTFILGAHAADTAQMILLQNLYRLRIGTHHFKKSHILGYLV